MVGAAGVDTWSVCWYVGEATTAQRQIQQLATEKGPRSMLIPDRMAGHRVGWFPGTNLVFAEGHPNPDGLCAAQDLPDAVTRLVEAMGDYGFKPPTKRLVPREKPVRRSNGYIEMQPVPDGGEGFAGIRRLDSTCDLTFERGVEGVAVLAGIAALPVPRCKTQIIRETGGHRIETVYLRGSSGKRVLGRWYDKGIESSTARRGELIRPEDQRRYVKSIRLDVETVASGTFVRDQFVRRFEPLWRASKGIKVAGAVELAERIAELVDEGVLTPRQGVDVAGWLLLEQSDANRQSRATWYRKRRRCADLGLVVADGTVDPVDIDIHSVIEEALDSEVWGQG